MASASRSSQVRTISAIPRSSSATSACGVCAAEAGDDELHAHQRAFGEVGIERGDAAVVGLRQQRADALAHLRACSGRAARRRAPRRSGRSGRCARTRARAAASPGRECPRVHSCSCLDADLEQLVAREGVEDVEQRLAVVAGRRIAGRRQHRVDLVAQERDLAGRAHVGLRREQADEADLALGRCRRAR